jgi:hypothetical protein
MASDRRWFDSSQPQTLQGAVMLCYITAAFGVLALILGSAPSIVAVLLGVGGFGVANEKRWGYWLAVAAAVLNVLVLVSAVFLGYSLLSLLLSLLFAVVLVALLLHPHSREYQRIWFR